MYSGLDINYVHCFYAARVLEFACCKYDKELPTARRRIDYRTRLMEGSVQSKVLASRSPPNTKVSDKKVTSR